MRVHQLVPSFMPGDAMGQAALHTRLLLRRLGLHGELYAGEVASGFSSLVRHAAQLRPAPDDLVIYHHGIASPLSGRLMHLPCRRAVVFHNITPARFYPGTRLAEALRAGRAELAALAGAVELSVGVSRFNCAELTEAGHANVRWVPLFVEPERFVPERADPRLRARLDGPGPKLLVVGRVVPHKRVDDAVRLLAELRHIAPDARLWVVGGYAQGDAYFRQVQRQAAQVGGVEFLGKVTHGELVAAYRGADLLVSMSEHEGFGVPLLEAMAADLPVLAYAAAAVPETLGGHGLTFDEKRFAALAELAAEVLKSPALRRRVVAGQRRRLEELSAEVAKEQLAAALAPLLPAPRKRRRPAKPRVAFVVQRFGELIGGAELHARQVATRLSPHWDITVLTSCAKDHLTWANELPPGPDRDGRLKVLRFPAERTRAMRPFNALSRRVFGTATDRLAEEHWLAEQGPSCPGLLSYLSDHRDDFDGFVFFTYLYAPTALGVSLVADRALVVPTAHDEPPLSFDAFADVFTRPAALLCNTPEERALIDRRFPGHARARVVGVGVDVPVARPERFCRQLGIAEPYLLYVGRLEEGKGVKELLSLYAGLRGRYHDAPLLLLAGAGDLDIRGEGVRYLGRLSEQEKFDALAGALAAVVPSRLESLSLLALEAFAVGTPVLVNGACEVLVGQARRSGAGLAWHDADDFMEVVRQVGLRRAVLSRRARAFAKKHRWSQVVEVYRAELAQVVRRSGERKERRA